MMRVVLHFPDELNKKSFHTSFPILPRIGEEVFFKGKIEFYRIKDVSWIISESDEDEMFDNAVHIKLTPSK